MILKFTNKQIYFSIESIWEKLDYRFKAHLNDLVTLNSDEDFIQDVTVSVPILMQCYEAMSSGSYGCTTDMAEVLLVSLRDQLLENNNIEEYSTYLAEVAANNELPEEERIQIEEVIPFEKTLALIAVSEYKLKDKAKENAKILSGKTQILL